MSEQKKVLVVDDHHELRDELAVFFSAKGYEVETLADGKDLLNGYKSKNYDIILMDTQMDHSTGYEVCAELRKLDSEIIIIGMSGDRSYRSEWIKAGANEFVSKDRLYGIDSIFKKYLGEEQLPVQIKNK